MKCELCDSWVMSWWNSTWHPGCKYANLVRQTREMHQELASAWAAWQEGPDT